MILSYVLFWTLWLLNAPIIGLATVIDGDTIEIRGQRIRLHGIDAPESSQLCTDRAGASVRCGQQSALKLDSLLKEKTCRCEVQDMDRYGRAVAICYAGGTNINEWMVTSGQALAYRKYSADYVADEQRANEEHRGIWKYKFEKPWDYRASKRNASDKQSSTRHSTERSSLVQPGKSEKLFLSPDSLTSTSKECTIKGNISRDGARIYHTPKSPWYARTKVDQSKGERWFCSEEEAQQAGWRSAHR